MKHLNFIQTYVLAARLYNASKKTCFEIFKTFEYLFYEEPYFCLRNTQYEAMLDFNIRRVSRGIMFPQICCFQVFFIWCLCHIWAPGVGFSLQGSMGVSSLKPNKSHLASKNISHPMVYVLSTCLFSVNIHKPLKQLIREMEQKGKHPITCRKWIHLSASQQQSGWQRGKQELVVRQQYSQELDLGLLLLCCMNSLCYLSETASRTQILQSKTLRI